MPVIENDPSARVQGKPLPLIARETVPPLIGGDAGPLPLLSEDVELVLGPDDDTDNPEGIIDPINSEPLVTGQGFDDLGPGRALSEAFL